MIWDGVAWYGMVLQTGKGLLSEHQYKSQVLTKLVPPPPLTSPSNISARYFQR